MWTLIISIILKIASSEAAKTAIAIGVNKLLDAKGDGITKELAKTMVEGIAKSKHNPTTEDAFQDALQILK